MLIEKGTKLIGTVNGRKARVNVNEIYIARYALKNGNIKMETMVSFSKFYEPNKFQSMFGNSLEVQSFLNQFKGFQNEKGEMI